ncbi:uncharacterized protein EI97DRAFT_463836 [Westerdykella ornata]|uniref:Uncharacterized protein n=1 Tax=Westerdykella ornata TaxID=318751 RepID=A0A6A6JY42_WESOR|nr:uncharacterized protein EI97DRAFT_463836 [Westerdykella ornata]KAF2281522.1 hypothetical protein EI97DRAFT_463836 [Westerdykella ornata]
MPPSDRFDSVANTSNTCPEKFSDHNGRLPIDQEGHRPGFRQEEQDLPRPPPPPPPPPGTPPPENMPRSRKRRATDLDGLVHPSRRMRARQESSDASDEEQRPKPARGDKPGGGPKYKATDANLIPLGTRRKRPEDNSVSVSLGVAPVGAERPPSPTEKKLNGNQSQPVATPTPQIVSAEGIVRFDNATGTCGQVRGDTRQTAVSDTRESIDTRDKHLIQAMSGCTSVRQLTDIARAPPVTLTSLIGLTGMTGPFDTAVIDPGLRADAMNKQRPALGPGALHLLGQGVIIAKILARKVCWTAHQVWVPMNRNERAYDDIDYHRPDEDYHSRSGLYENRSRDDDWEHHSFYREASYDEGALNNSSGYENDRRRYRSREEPSRYRHEGGNGYMRDDQYGEGSLRRYDRGPHAFPPPYHGYEELERHPGRHHHEKERNGRYEQLDRHRYAYDRTKRHYEQGDMTNDTANSRFDEAAADTEFKIKGRHRELTGHAHRDKEFDREHDRSGPYRKSRSDARKKHNLRERPEETREGHDGHGCQHQKEHYHQRNLRLSPYEFSEKRRSNENHRKQPDGAKYGQEPSGTYKNDRPAVGAPYDHVKDRTVSQNCTRGGTLRDGHFERNNERTEGKQNRNTGRDELHERERLGVDLAEQGRRKENLRRREGNRKPKDTNKVKVHERAVEPDVSPVSVHDRAKDHIA